jgi:general secretion pathway protein J
MEVLIAFFVFSLVITLLFGSYTGILHSISTTQELVEEYQGVKNAMERIQLDLDSALIAGAATYKVPDMDAPPDPWRIKGEKENIDGLDFMRLRFASLAHVDLAGDGASGGIAEIVYYVTRDNAGEGYVLRRRDQLFEDLYGKKEIKGDPVLLTGVRSFTVKFLDEEDEWQDAWDSDTDDQGYGTPKAIALTVEEGGPDVRQGEGSRFSTTIRLPMHRAPKK